MMIIRDYCLFQNEFIDREVIKKLIKENRGRMICSKQ